jgi:quinol monooxygenase YgiN
MSVVVTAVFHPAPGKKQELAAAMRAGIEAVHQEQGCELYAIHDAEDGTITMIEKWSSVEDLDVHGQGEAVAQLNGDIADLIAKPTEVTRMTALPVGSEQQGTL